jgi:Na+/proline symporter
MAERQQLIALFVYLGGMSAATGMVIVETIALSTMICNDLVMPVLLRLPIEEMGLREDYSGLLLTIRRCSIVLVLLLGYAYFRTIGEFFTLVSIGLVSFVAVAQFAPALLGGIFWKGGSRTGAICGLLAGFAVWFYTLSCPPWCRPASSPRISSPGDFWASSCSSRLNYSVSRALTAYPTRFSGVCSSIPAPI